MSIECATQFLYSTFNVGLDDCLQTYDTDFSVFDFVYKPLIETCDFYGGQYTWPIEYGVDVEKLMRSRTNAHKKVKAA